MKPEAQRIAIAEACGWKKDERGWITPSGRRAEHNEMLDVSYRVVQHDCPDYLNDLNAMHEAEMVLTALEWPAYRIALTKICTSYALVEWQGTAISATAAQRAEAFLRVKGLWME